MRTHVTLTAVSRIIASSPTLGMTLAIDIMTEVFPVHVGQQLTFLLASSLQRQGAADGNATVDRDAWRLDQPGAQGLADEYEYVMYGKVCARASLR